MNYEEKHKILKNFVDRKWGKEINITNRATSSPDNMNSGSGYLVFYLKNWDKYKELLSISCKYNHKELSRYLLEIIRVRLPELKNTTLYITPFDQTSCLLGMPKVVTDHYLYII